MGGYLTGFIVYTTAMIGVIFIAVFAYSKFSFKGSSKSKFLNVEDCISLAPRKNLYVIKAGKEKFLVASDAERTTLISKLDEGSNQKYLHQSEQDMSSSVDDLPVIVDFSTIKKDDKKSKKIFKNIVNNI